ncbi:hypothetical protein DFH06DRAFT_1352907 [Mycena polygramma]|nr:hypothetical protein DFH06DRAFT_1352907 [Mycena polygramma]
MASNPTLPSSSAPTSAVSAPTIQRTDTVRLSDLGSGDYGIAALHNQPTQPTQPAESAPSAPPATADSATAQKGKEKTQPRNASPGPSNPLTSSTAAARRHLDAMGLRAIDPVPVDPKDKKKFDAKTETRAIHRDLHAVAQQSAEHVRDTSERFEALDETMESFQNQLAGVQISLAENGVAAVAGDPVFLDLAIGNNPLIQRLVAGHKAAVANNQVVDARLAGIERTQQQILDRLQALTTPAPSPQPAAAPAAAPAPVTAPPPASLAAAPASADAAPLNAATATSVAPPPPYSAPPALAAPAPAITTTGAGPVTLPDVALRGFSSSSLEGRMGAMEGMLQQIAAGMKRGRSPSPEPARAVRAHVDDAPANSPAPPVIAHTAPPTGTIYAPTGVAALPAGITHAPAAPPAVAPSAGTVYAPGVVAAAPAGIVHAPATLAPPPAGIIHAAAALAPPSSVAPVASPIAAPPVGIVHGPAASALPAGVVHAAPAPVALPVVVTPGGSRPRRNAAPPRNRAAEVRLASAQWGQDITSEARAVLKAVLKDYDLSAVFTRAYRLTQEPGTIVIGFVSPEHAHWLIPIFNASRVAPYEHIFAYPN